MFQRRFIAFIFLLAIPLLGCHIPNKAAISNQGDNTLVRKLNAILLTTDDLPITMKLDIGSSSTIRGFGKQPPVVDGFSQSWNSTRPEETINVKYWLFPSVSKAQTAADQWRGFLSSQSFYQPEPNAAEVIGDATWRIENTSSIWFVKNNVLVYIMARRPFINQLKFTRSVARKIETKINAALNQQ